MWNTSKVRAIGTCRLKVINPSNNKKYSVEFFVVDNDDLTPLLGSKASQQMGLITVNTDSFCCGYFHNNSMTMLINVCICMQIKCMISIHVCDILSHKQVSHKQVSHKQVSHKQVIISK